MTSQTKSCQVCKQSFMIEPEDFHFYEQIKVPPPTECPDCRQRRRYAWRNEKTLYRRKCDLCQKDIVSVYSSNKPFKIYCPTCWWSDKWDAMSFARAYDPDRPFLDQFRELQLQVPRIALLSKNSVNSDYTNHTSDSKNCYYSFCCFDNEEVYYSSSALSSKDSVDCSYYLREGAEKSYECIDGSRTYACQFGILLENCSECAYCFDCKGCSNCFMSSNLRNKQYYFENQPCNKEDYQRKITELNLGSYAVRRAQYLKFQVMIEAAVQRFVVSEKSENSTGGVFYNCKNSQNCFDSFDLEDCRYLYATVQMKNCEDLYHAGYGGSEHCYECHAITRSYNVKFSHLCYDNSDLTYCDSCHNSENLFGCAGIRHGKYAILNQKYSPEEYAKLADQIIQSLKMTGEWGEFFPPKFSPFGYNEARGDFYMPMKKEEALALGFNWEDDVTWTTGKETLRTDQVPDDIKDVEDDILKQVLACTKCGRNYSLIRQELEFYRRESIPVPRECFVCRDNRRASLRQPRKLWDGTCLKCQASFKTTHDPAKKERVYCEKC
ncbi:MAG: hypothetical protein V1821_03080, partial [bacterium]